MKLSMYLISTLIMSSITTNTNSIMGVSYCEIAIQNNTDSAIDCNMQISGWQCTNQSIPVKAQGTRHTSMGQQCRVTKIEVVGKDGLFKGKVATISPARNAPCKISTITIKKTDDNNFAIEWS